MGRNTRKPHCLCSGASVSAASDLAASATASNDSALAVSVPMASAYVFHRSLGVFGLGGMCSLGFGGLGISGRLFCSAGIGGVGAVARAWAAHAPVALAAVESAWLAVDWVNGFELNSFGH